MSRILFVDDIPKILGGLKRSLSHRRRDWDMHFVNSGQEALEFLEDRGADVLVTDLLMPGMSGKVLLEKVVERWPGMVRVTLSGYSGQDMILQTVRLAHQFLAKPCAPALLEEVLERVLSGGLLLPDRVLWSRVAGMTTLPVIPELKAALDRELASEQPSMERLAEMVSQDVVLAAKCMNLVNSTFFYENGRIGSLQRGLGVLGPKFLNALCLSTNVFTDYDASAAPGFSLSGLWKHSLRTAMLARALAEDDGCERSHCEEVYTCGLLHDVGKMVEVCTMPGDFDRVLQTASDGRGLYAAEGVVLGTSHAAMGACLLHLWGLPETVVDVVAGHHPGPETGEPSGHLPYVCAANMLDHEFCHITSDRCRRVLDETPFCRWGLGDRLPRWRELAGQFARGCA